MDVEQIRALDERGARAWPAVEVVELDGWQLRWSDGLTRRGNSVWPRAALGHIGLQDRLDAVEAFYGARGGTAIFQVSPASEPAGLDDVLEERGYEQFSPTEVQVARLDDLAGAPPGRVLLRENLDEGWVDVWRDIHQATASEGGTARSILTRSEIPTVFALLEVDGAIVSVGRGALDRGWLGIHNMATVPSHRQQGSARQILSALAAWGVREGANRAYLQVAADNEAARRLYASVGFDAAYRYFYWRAPTASA
ncbi:MAG TPA: GNAT family N-acetyltransferase [Acidimicrobiales bacterium]|nr:GNAT family N-acetyltransferase [Acidimicrobiales bacterium]